MYIYIYIYIYIQIQRILVCHFSLCTYMYMHIQLYMNVSPPKCICIKTQFYTPPLGVSTQSIISLLSPLNMLTIFPYTNNSSLSTTEQTNHVMYTLYLAIPMFIQRQKMFAMYWLCQALSRQAHDIKLNMYHTVVFLQCHCSDGIIDVQIRALSRQATFSL